MPRCSLVGCNMRGGLKYSKITLHNEHDCAVCLQKCHHPTKLPCGHIFCFLCVKGVAIQNRKCAMCRAVIPPDYLDHPVLLEKLSPEQRTLQEPLLENQWYYEGRNGWWKYDERSNMELETAYNSGGPECTLLLAGALYSIDFQSMTQVRCSDQTRRRRVRRDTPLFPAKGIAGIKAVKMPATEETKRENHENENININSSQNESEIIEIMDEDNEENVSTQTTEPAVTVDDVSNEFDRLRIMNIHET